MPVDLREIIYDFCLSHGGFVHLLQQLSGVFFSAAGHFGQQAASAIPLRPGRIE
jgi:hypothetical protein